MDKATRARQTHVRREGRNHDHPPTLDLHRTPEAWMEGPPGMASESGGVQQAQP